MKFYFKCPKCGNDEQFVRPNEKLGFALYLGYGLLFTDYMRARVQCMRCLYIFRPPPVPSSPLAAFAVWILGVTVISGIVAVVLFCAPPLAQALPAFSVIPVLEEAILMQPRVAAYLLGALFVLIPVSCCVAVMFSNAKFRKQLAKEYHLKPLSRRGLPPPEAPKPEAPAAGRISG